MSTVLVSGANKGIGRALVAKYLSRPGATVVATVRNPDSAEARTLQELPAGPGSRVIVLKVEATSDCDALEAAKSIEQEGVTNIDILIANAGIFTPAAYLPVSQVSIDQVKDHLDINTVGPLRLFQAFFPLLKRSSQPKFILISSLVGTIGGLDQIPYPNGAYGGSKAAANFFTRKIHFENEDITSLAIHPGAVKTVSGNEACQAVGFPEAFVEIEDSVTCLVERIDAVS